MVAMAVAVTAAAAAAYVLSRPRTWTMDYEMPWKMEIPPPFTRILEINSLSSEGGWPLGSLNSKCVCVCVCAKGYGNFFVEMNNLWARTHFCLLQMTMTTTNTATMMTATAQVRFDRDDNENVQTTKMALHSGDVCVAMRMECKMASFRSKTAAAYNNLRPMHCICLCVVGSVQNAFGRLPYIRPSHRIACGLVISIKA